MQREKERAVRMKTEEDERTACTSTKKSDSSIPSVSKEPLKQKISEGTSSTIIDADGDQLMKDLSDPNRKGMS